MTQSTDQNSPFTVMKQFMATLSKDKASKKEFQNICSSNANGKRLTGEMKGHLDIIKQRKLYGVPAEMTDANDLQP